MRGIVAAALLLASVTAHAADKKEDISRKAVGFATRSMVGVIQVVVASKRASGHVLEDLKRQRDTGKKLVPDLPTLKVALELRMRVSNGELKFGEGWKRYPEDKDFGRAARKAQKEFQTYVRSLPADADLTGQSVASSLDALLDRTMKALVFSLPLDFKLTSAPQPPPPTPEEAAYLESTSIDPSKIQDPKP